MAYFDKYELFLPFYYASSTILSLPYDRELYFNANNDWNTVYIFLSNLYNNFLWMNESCAYILFINLQFI